MFPPNAVWLVATVFPFALAQIASLPFQDCSSPSSNSPSSPKISISTVYGQVTNSSPRARFLNLTLIGTSNSEIFYSSNTSNPLLCMSKPFLRSFCLSCFNANAFLHPQKQPFLHQHKYLLLRLIMVAILNLPSVQHCALLLLSLLSPTRLRASVRCLPVQSHFLSPPLSIVPMNS